MTPARSIAGIARAALLGALVVIALGATVIGIAFANVLDARTELFERLDPAVADALRLRAAVLDQETGIRGFALSGGEGRFLEPFESGRRAEGRILDRLRDELSGTASDRAAARIEGVSDAVADWRGEIVPRLRSVASLDDPAAVETVLAASKSQFDVVRAELGRLDAELGASRTVARGDLDRATTELVVAMVTAFALLAGVGVAGWWLLRRRIVEPIDRLVEATDGVAAGDFGRAVGVRGPAEIEHLGRQVDAMRRRIDGARAELDAQAAELARSNRDLEQFAYVASHDLQEPLRKVASFCQLLDQRYGDQLDERGRTYVSFAVDGAKRMQALISDLLDFSRVGRTTESFVECDLGDLLGALGDRLAEPLAEQHGAVRVEGPLPTVHGDPSLLAALFANLLGNAVKYRRPDVPPEVVVSASRRDDDWDVAVTDNGIGIEPRYRDRVFVIFQRLHGRDAYEGTGIGLALCKKIAEFHGGSIGVDDRPDGLPGTVVHVRLPASAAHGPRPTDSTPITTHPGAT